MSSFMNPRPKDRFTMAAVGGASAAIVSAAFTLAAYRASDAVFVAITTTILGLVGFVTAAFYWPRLVRAKALALASIAALLLASAFIRFTDINQHPAGPLGAFAIFLFACSSLGISSARLVYNAYEKK
jgi:hypothetical protein